MENHNDHNDYIYLAGIRNNYYRLIDGGCSLRRAREVCLQNHSGGFEKGKDGTIIIAYKGNYLINLAQSATIYKEI